MSVFWQWFSSISSTDVGLFLGIVGLFVGIVGLFATIILRGRQPAQHQNLQGLIHIYKVSGFNPSMMVGAYSTGDEYLPIGQDAEIQAALRERRDLVISGRQGIGKSHAAIRNLQAVLPRWRIILPAKKTVQKFDEVSVGKKRYVLMLDDLNEFVRAADPTAGEGVLDFVEHLRSQCKELIVVATIRRTSPEFDEMAADPKVIARWKHIQLSDWTDEQGKILEKKTHAGLEHWDGTPLSVKQPSSEMLLKYEKAPQDQKAILRSLALLRRCGLKPVNLALLKDVFLSDVMSGDQAGFEAALYAVGKLGFLKQAAEEIQAYDPYLEAIRDWLPRPPHFAAVVDILTGAKRVEDLLLFGKYRIEEGKLDEALQVLNRAREIQPDLERIPYRIGVVYGRMRRWPDAEAAYKEAVTLKPGWATAWFRLSNALSQQGKDDEAKQALAWGHDVGSDQDPFTRGSILAQMLVEDGRYQEAINEYDSILAAQPENSAAFFQKGRILRKMEKWPEARVAHARAVELMPGSAEAYFGLAEPLQRLGDPEGAMQACEKALEIKPNLLPAYITLAHLLLIKNDLSAAEQVLKKGLQVFPESAKLHSYLGEVYARNRQNPEAESEYQQAMELEPEYKEAYVGLSKQKRVKNDYETAIQLNLKALDLDPEFPEAHFGLGMCYFTQRDTPAAVDHFRNAVFFSPGFAAAHYYLGLSLFYTGDVNEAIEELKKAMKLRHKKEACLNMLAKSYCKLHQNDKAIECIAEGIKAGLDPLRIAQSPDFSTLRSDARFKALVESHA